MRINVPSVTRKNIPVDVNLHNPSIRGLACLLNTVVLKTNKQTTTTKGHNIQQAAA